MAKCHRNNVGSIALDHRHATKTSTSGGHFRLWNSTLRRIIFDAVSCGSTSRYKYDNDDDDGDITSTASTSRRENHAEDPKTEKNVTNVAENETEASRKKKEEELREMKEMVKELEGEDLMKKRIAAKRVRKLAKEEGLEVRGTLAMLGVIPLLVGMVDHDENSVKSQIESLYALLNLGIGNDANKAAIVKVGAVHKMLKLIDSSDSSVCEAVVANFLGLSALDSNKPIIGSSGAIPFLVRILRNLDNKSSSQAKQDALRALYNLSITPTNISFVLETDLVSFLINSIGDMEISERVLSILSNLVSTPEGRKAISTVRDAIPILMDVLNWTDSPKCQEKASYILMIMAHKSCGDRHAMIEAGIASTLLELTLVGTPLAQKRASRILECLRIDKGKQVSGSYGGNLGATVSAPICGSSSSFTKTEGRSVEDEDMMSEEKKAVKQLVQQSLQNNMRKIVKRANLRQDFIPSERLNSLTSSLTSKSLPL
ncbi:unnamed protein product [Lupinus luteus]|uniref:U-box domain-containing protein n=1 Tax=Lupinus luteus TaxID=3873 RepID=A0AAV1Y1Z5_LUPLU